MPTAPITLLFGVHAHQPVGNFPAVIDEAHVRCYGMFLRVLARYPAFRFSVHFSGWLLDYLLQKFPDDMALLAEMTRRGQVEWFGSGDCEPVLAAIPQRDRIAQLDVLAEKIARHFGARLSGAWLTERVWESSVVSALAATGIRYVAVDDYHFLCAGMDAARLDGFYSTEDDGQRLDLFPIAEEARYRLPFSPAAEAVRWLEELARQGRRAAIYFDDIEKFGIWPETYAWVYEQHWLTQFIEGVLASPLIRTATYADFHAAETTRGIVYPPTTSYIEMNEWTLPAAQASVYHALVETEKAAGRFAAHKPFLRGGIWRNFMSRYPEANWMHKRMLGLSQRLAELPENTGTPAQRAEMQAQLHRAQANDAYWHGLFGGLYLPHLRRAVWHNLLRLEATLERLAPLPPSPSPPTDIDLDGHAELVLRGKTLRAIVRIDGDAALAELSSLALAHNFGDTLRRHAELYHQKIGAGGTAPSATHAAGNGGIASAHDRVAFLHAITPADAVPDARPRGIALDTLITADGRRQPLHDYRPLTHDEATANSYGFVTEGDGWRVEKRYTLHDDTLEIAWRLAGAAAPGCRLETEINLAMPSCDGFGGRYVLDDGRIPGGFGQPLKLPALAQIDLRDSELRSSDLSGDLKEGGIRLTAVPPTPTFFGQPHHTVSQSEAGFEKIMQAVCLTLCWPAGDDWQRLTLKPLAAP